MGLGAEFPGRPGRSLVLALALWSATAALPVATAADTHEVCALCHVETVGETPSLADPSRCVECHVDVEVSPAGATAVSHLGRHASEISSGTPDGPVTCVTCHSPHPNGREYQLWPLETTLDDPEGTVLDETTRFCLGCHEKLAEIHGNNGHYVRHPVGLVLAADGRPGPGDPVLPLVDVDGTAETDDDVIACVTCHQIHGNATQFLLRWESGNGREACISCHRHLRPPEENLVASGEGREGRPRGPLRP